MDHIEVIHEEVTNPAGRIASGSSDLNTADDFSQTSAIDLNEPHFGVARPLRFPSNIRQCTLIPAMKLIVEVYRCQRPQTAGQSEYLSLG